MFCQWKSVLWISISSSRLDRRALQGHCSGTCCRSETTNPTLGEEDVSRMATLFWHIHWRWYPLGYDWYHYIRCTGHRRERELLLIGTIFFVAYPISWCSRMLGNFRISPPISFYCRMQHRDSGSSKDLLCLKEIMLNWEYNGLDQLKVMNNSCDKTKYFEWLLPKLLPNDLSAEKPEAKHQKEDDDRLIETLCTFKWRRIWIGELVLPVVALFFPWNLSSHF